MHVKPKNIIVAYIFKGSCIGTVLSSNIIYFVWTKYFSSQYISGQYCFILFERCTYMSFYCFTFIVKKLILYYWGKYTKYKKIYKIIQLL